LRAFGAIRRADVSVIMIDAEEGITEQDVKIVGYVHEQGKPSIVVMNKWDLIEKDTNTINQFDAKVKEDLKFMNYIKTIYVSAKTGQRTDKILDVAMSVVALVKEVDVGV
jgi:GTP-binding protein